MRIVNLKDGKQQMRARLVSKLTMVFLLSMILSTVKSQDCPVGLACLHRINVSLDPECRAEIYPDRIHSSPDAMADNQDCDYDVTILDKFDNVITINDYSSDGYPIIDAIIHPEFLLDSFKVMLNVDESDAPCWGWMIVEDKLDPDIAQVPDLVIDCYDNDSALLDPQDDIKLYADLSTDTDLSDQNMMSFDLESPNPLPSPIGYIESVHLDFTADLPGDLTLVELFDSNDMLLCNEANPVSSVKLSCLDNDQMETVSFPLSVKFTHSGADPMDTVVLNNVKLTFAVASYFEFHTAPSTDNCTDVDIVILKDEFDPNPCDNPNTSRCSSFRRVEYTGFDQSDNSGDTLQFTMCYLKRSVDDFTIESPLKLDCDFDLADLPGLVLDDFPFDPNQHGLCKFNIGLEEKVTPGCGAERNIERKYTIIDWCTGDIRTIVQYIHLIDHDAPIITCPEDNMTIYTNVDDCLASFDVYPLPVGEHPTAIQALDDLGCTAVDDIIIEVEYLKNTELDPLDPSLNFSKGIKNSNGSWTLPELELGFNWIRYTATDECGNSSSCFFEVEVLDGLPPRAICDQFTVVTLQDNGWARMLPISLDDGSYDDCGGEITYTAKRLEIDHPCAGSPDFEDPDDLDKYGFGSYLQFCCADVGVQIPVVLKVTDSSGNHSTCQVIVEVQDKTNVLIENADPYVSIGCDTYDEDQLYGTPNKPTVYNACGDFDVDYEDDPDLDACGIGVITRKWFYFSNGQKIYINPAQIINVAAEYFVVDFPSDRTANCTNYNTSLGQQPTINGTNIDDYEACANLSWTFEDQIFYNVEGLCMKILRTWIVIDHCVYEPNSDSQDGYYSDTQLIKIPSSVPPVVTNCPADDWFSPDPGTCETSIVLHGPDAVDGCIGSPIGDEGYSYEVRNYITGALIASGNGRDDILSLTTEAYLVTWFIEDFCGNVNDECVHLVDVVDEKAPTPYCYGGITTVVMDSIFTSGEPMIAVWASDLDINSEDDCDDDLTFAFSTDPTDTYREYTCDSLGIKNVRVYVFDDAGNYDYCETTINIQSNGTVCGPYSGPRIAGKIETWDERDVSDVEVALEQMQNANMNYQMTNDLGLYTFNDAYWSSDYQLTASKNDSPLNGVSTLDIVLIQRHILGLEKLNTPYQLIAADINKSESVSAIDLIELRKLILGIYDHFPNNDSWRFLDRNYLFSDDNSPWPFTEEISIYEIDEDKMYNDFVGIKTGDVNGSVKLSILDDGTESRSASALNLSIPSQTYKANEVVKVDFTSSNFKDIIGFQFSMNFNANDLIFMGVEAGSLELNSNNLGLNNLSNGLISLSWNNDLAIDVAEDKVLFSIYFESMVNSSSNQFELSKSGVQKEAYNSQYEVLDVNLESRNLSPGTDKLVLYQNIPNPFSELTNIQFYLPQSSKIKFEVCTVTGSMVHSFERDFVAGQHSIAFNPTDINLNGLLYYKISTEKETATKKMLYIK